ncbi:MAG: hypothetical protein U0Z17_01780 [Bacteroidales bacterium]
MSSSVKSGAKGRFIRIYRYNKPYPRFTVPSITLLAKNSPGKADKIESKTMQILCIDDSTKQPWL